MKRHLLVLAAVFVTQSAAIEAGAACTAGNPNAGVIESTPTIAFTDHGNSTVTHSLTGLMWKQCTQGLSGPSCANGTATLMPWSGALAAAVADSTAGHSDWRLPNKKELESIVESCGFGPAINMDLFPATPASAFWSGTTAVSYGYAPDRAWFVAYSDGATSLFGKPGLLYARLVRGGKPLGAVDANRPLRSTLDIDGNGAADALTDGLLVIRYLFGLRGSSLIHGAVGAGAQRITATDIGNYIQSLTPQ